MFIKLILLFLFFQIQKRMAIFGSLGFLMYVLSNRVWRRQF